MRVQISSSPPSPPIYYMVEKNCLECNCIMLTRQIDIDKGHGKFCGRKCFGIFRKKQSKQKREELQSHTNSECSWCNKLYFCRRFKTIKHGFRFCSRKCKDIAQRIGGIKEIQPPHYGEVSSSYRRDAFENFVNECNKCKYKENMLALIVHHKDRNRKNNKLENLEILCWNCHMILHLGEA